jgi:[acyl-carrier-protein] S-malonyltransferase
MNSPKQTVVSGTFDGLAAAEKACTEAGARRAIRLAVAGPFHSPLMQKAADQLEKAIAGYAFADPSIPLFSNVTGKKVTEGAAAKKSAVLHLTHPVLWTDEEKVLGEHLSSDSAAEWQIIEVGPGKVLSGLWKDSGFGEKWESVPVNTAEAIQAL